MVQNFEILKSCPLPGSKIGCGFWACVFAKGKNQVIKLQSRKISFLHEIKTLRCLQQTGIVPRVDELFICPSANKYYGIVMERADLTLRQFLQTSVQLEGPYYRLPKPLYLKLISQLENLQHQLRRHKIKHNDLHADNIMVIQQPRFRLIIVDFGKIGVTSRKDDCQFRAWFRVLDELLGPGLSAPRLAWLTAHPWNFLKL